MPGDGILLVGHGSREGGANDEFEALARAYREARPELRVETAYLELAHPLIFEALAALAPAVGRLGVVPLLLFAAGHAKDDLPRALADARRRFPSLPMAAAPALGAHPSMIEVAAARAAPALGDDARVRGRTLLLVVGRGASDPDATDAFSQVARRIGEGRGLLHVEPAFMSVAQPSLDASLELAARLRPDRLVVLPYLLFAGQLVAKLQRQIDDFGARHPWIRTQVAPHLGLDDRIVALVDERAHQALAGSHADLDRTGGGVG